MPWTATVQLDEDKDNVGVATAVWNAGEADEFAYSRRALVSVASGQAFAAEAVAAREAHDAKATQNSNLAGTLTQILNDAEAGD